MLKVYNTLSGKKETVLFRKNRRINFFVCGPTVYDFSHIGHARTYIIFDCFVKYLRIKGFTVFYLQNITDIDDKIIERAKEKGVSARELAEFFAVQHLKDMETIGVDSINEYAKATNYIPEIINQVQQLLKKGYAYELSDGIYYDIGKFKNYGKLSGRTVIQAEDAVSRIDEGKDKRNKGDFSLWKFKKEREPSWPSPFGEGRPGWHIEDTAITEKFFGAQYDIHGGARDLIFPHHEAEISQMEAISGKAPLARYWMHTGFLTIGGQKMSKSLHNFTLISDFLKRYPYRHLRLWVAKNLWRSAIDYSESAVIEVKSSLEKIEEFLRKIKNQKSKIKTKNQKLKKLLNKAKKNFYKNLDDDFNTPKAFAVIYDFIRQANKMPDKNMVSKKATGDILKFFEEINDIFDIIDFEKLEESNVPGEVKKLVEQREGYRKNQEWQKADEIRKQIEKQGFVIEDTKEGTIVKKVSNFQFPNKLKILKNFKIIELKNNNDLLPALRSAPCGVSLPVIRIRQLNSIRRRRYFGARCTYGFSLH